MTQLFVNLPVQDLAKTTEFFTALGFTFDPNFTDENCTCMLVGDGSYVMLLVEDFYKGFVKKDLADTATHTECILAISVESRDVVNDLVHRALAAGGSPSNEPMEFAGMYGWSFQDLDGHLWEVFYMDPEAAPGNA